MKNKKAFTLVELLAVIVVIAILGGLAAVSINYIVQNSKKSVYKNYESALKTAAENYLIENTDKLPPEPGEGVEFTKSDKITYGVLTSGLFMDEIKDPNGGNCDGYVIIKRGKDIGFNYNLTYEYCLMCDNYITKSDDYVCKKDT